MNAFHVIWTKPAIENGQRFYFTPTHLLTMVVSALCWRLYNGKIQLFTDTAGLRFIKQQQLEWVWSEPINTTILNAAPTSIHAPSYWAAGKILVMAQMDSPAAWLDTDLIIVRKIHVDNFAVTALHAEMPDPEVYPSPQMLPTPTGYRLPEWFNEQVAASNTAFLAITNDALRTEYCREAIRFMQHNPSPEGYGHLKQMVFAEQRLLSVCAHHHQSNVNYLLTEPFCRENDSCIHLWGFKNEMAANSDAAQWYTHGLIHHFCFLSEKFPEFGRFIQQFI